MVETSLTLSLLPSELKESSCDWKGQTEIFLSITKDAQSRLMYTRKIRN
jgi:hypothetical protein